MCIEAMILEWCHSKKIVKKQPLECSMQTLTLCESALIEG